MEARIWYQNKLRTESLSKRNRFGRSLPPWSENEGITLIRLLVTFSGFRVMFEDEEC
jgi:hypothetical protein